jgi:uncharacterized membrane protein YqjE
MLRSIRRALLLLLQVVLTRIELASLEAEEALIRLLMLVMIAAAVLFFGLMSVVAITCSLILLFWSEDNTYLLIGVNAVYLSLFALTAWWLWHSIKSMPVPFGGTIDALKKDHACLKSLQ